MMDRILLHICCAPCALFPLDTLRESNFQVVGFWYNPNIHPYLEYKKRLSEVNRLARLKDFRLCAIDEYDIRTYLKFVLDSDDDYSRCARCYEYRLAMTARYARENNFDCWTTTLLHSKYQQHQTIRQIGERLAERFDTQFLYLDFRSGWSDGLDESRKYRLYRQQYCGCIFSEYKRFADSADDILEKYEWYPRKKE